MVASLTRRTTLAPSEQTEKAIEKRKGRMKPHHLDTPEPLKTAILGAISALLPAMLALNSAPAIGQTASLRLEPRTNGLDLVVGSLSSTGALFLYTATDLHTLADAPSLVLETNTPMPGGLRLPVLPTGSYSDQAFFSATHWPGRYVEDFGDSEYTPDPVPPEMILVTSGAPDILVPQQSFTVDFFVTDTNGQTLAITARAEILVLREMDGQPHPDAVVAPPGGQVTNGHLRLTLTIQASTPLDGYTLGLELTLGSLGRAKGLTTAELQTLISLNNIQCQAGQTPKQCLDAWRLANADASATWSYPLAGSGHPVSGTFGEWRGEIKPDAHPPELIGTVHKGLDLAAVANSIVMASRGGVVSARGSASGAYLVVDHGTGWFSRYLHLDGSSIVVRVGQAVTNGQALATRLHSGGGWAEHLHFEVRLDANQARWGVGMPGRAYDPLQADGIFPVAAGSAPPRLEEFGLSRSHPGEIPFVKSAPTANDNGPVYLFAKFLDREERTTPGSGCDPDYQRLGLRSIGFTPDGATQSEIIRPENDSAIALLKPPLVGSPVPPTKVKGFARYAGQHTVSADRCNYFRYWWRWDTSAYANNRTGPRTLLLTGVDHNPTTNEFRFFFGPQVRSNLLALVATNQYQFTLVAHLGTNTPVALNNPALFVQPDEYKLEIIQTNGQPLSAVTWKEGTALLSGSTPFSRQYSVNTNEQGYTFTLPGTANPATLKLRVSSRLVPDIAHEIGLSATPVRATFVIRSFAGTPWDGVAVPSTVTATVTSVGQVFFVGSNGKTERGGPLFSTQVPAPRTFFVCSTVTGFPNRPGGPTVNRLGASSFIAVAGGGFWIDASAGAWRINGSTGQITDWEYQLRFCPSDLATGRPRLQIGTVTSLDVWLGADIPEENYTLTVE